MKHKKLAVKILLTLATLLLPLLWCAGTNTGLNAVLKASNLFVPGQLTFATTSGTLLTKTLTIRDIKYSENGHILAISQANLNWRQASITLYKLTGFEPYLPGQELLIPDRESTIDQIDAKITFADKQKDLAISLHGSWQHTPLTATLNATQLANNWSLQHANINIGKNTLSLTPGMQDTYVWEITLQQPELLFKNGSGALQASGQITQQNTSNNITAKIKAKAFKCANISIYNLQAAIALSDTPSAALQLNLTADQISIDQHIISAIKIATVGTLKQHSFVGYAQYANKPAHISALCTMQNDKWTSNNLILKYDGQSLAGSATFDSKQAQAKLNLSGQPFAIKTDLQVTLESKSRLSAKLDLYENPENHLQAVIKTKDRNLDGSVNIVAEDISLLMKFLPDVTRLKGLFKAQAQIAGTFDKPTVTVSAHLTQVTATLPALGIKIKPMELHLHNDGSEKFIIKGNGKMRRGPGEFTISGYIEPFKANFPHSISLVATNLEFIKNDNAQLIANTQLNFNFDHLQRQLNIKGHIDILSGNIYYKSKKTSTVKSKDVVFIDHNAHQQQSSFNVHPDLNIWIYEGVHFAGLGLDADITGNLDVTQRRDTLYGNGRVTIKEGSFKLPGQTLQIKKGRLLYPPGTLLANPSLDIKMHSNAQNIGQNTTDDASELEIFVRGTAQEPVIHETNITTNKDKVLSQIMLTGSSLISKNILQDKLKLTELGLKSRDDHIPGFFYNPSKQTSALLDKDLVIGRPLGDKLYMQYLQSMNEKNKRIKLKYALNNIWALGVETGNRGSGADLSFAIERD